MSPLMTLTKYKDNRIHSRSCGKFCFAIFRRKCNRHSYLHKMLYVCKILDPELPVNTSGRHGPSAFSLPSAICLFPMTCPELAGKDAVSGISTLPLLMDMPEVILQPHIKDKR